MSDSELGPVAAQRSAAQQVRALTRAKSAAVRFRFIARAEPNDAPPPLARLLRGSGGKGGAARLKLYLSMLWMARNEDRPVFQYPAQEWALLLGYGSTPSAARRVQDGFRWLSEEAFVELERRQGAPSAVRLLSDAGTGTPYMAPGLAIKRAPKAEREEHLYVQLNAALWTNGWIVELTGAAVAMYLVLLHEMRGEEKQVWFSPRMGRERYDLSDETRRKGLKELEERGLVKVTKRALHQGLFSDPVRTRYVYDLNPDVFQLLTPEDEAVGQARPRFSQPYNPSEEWGS
ncbi:hypothetical protein [Streptomyces sp. NPDC091649]|uniref:hypothetical protein n=1 Tax=Streptomyces sp. NPDC091649 TaxID=3366004 RepID=UPI003821A21D